ncbi:unnamed protein product [Euphydryas editha]|uniref:non-specific serine/threonine protein kinase n=1 Tax=Euphydryas editha TaxID=104508 RepID=A0AAU9UHS2_EUPED|nr:unnamed protein product [Euphydryas editha]
MGNQLVGVAPSQIFPVEHYLSDHVELTFDQSLGSTRFFKVARARTREGLVVVKVFAIHDPSLPLAEHKERILKIKEQLVSAFNCLPFQRVILTDKAGLLIREYCKYSVYDRMVTRPFLTVLEKKWITFQVLYALHRMHKLGICHGDIKLENIMVTSWLWVLLTDIASFKPTFLPDDNPADFSYFFDTSRRRLCYVAPERFVKAPDPNARFATVQLLEKAQRNKKSVLKNLYNYNWVTFKQAHHNLLKSTKIVWRSIIFYECTDYSGDDKNSGLLLSESPCKVGELVPSMDIFSTGCALVELWNDGTPALDLPGLLAYRNGEDRPPTMTLPDTCEPELRNLLLSMTERNPKDRRSAELYLDEARGKLFPEYFYSFLQSYMLIFSAQPILPADEKITRIYQDIKNIIKIFTQPSNSKNYQDLVDETTESQNVEIDALIKEGFRVMTINVADFEEESDTKTPEIKTLGPDSEGLILITSLVTSCIRGLHHCTSKLHCLEILQLLCENSSSETILDRILPYIIYLSHAPEARVRAAAVWCAARCVSCVRALPPADSNVFPEYVLPELAPRASDPALPVRIAYANNIGECGARRAACRACARCRRPTATCSRMWCAARCVSCVRALPPADSNVFPEYVLPELAPRASDPALPVRIAYANNIGECGARRAACRACARCRRPTATCSRMWCAARCVSCVRALPPADSNVFPEYVLPELAPRASDPALPVRIAYANNIGECGARRAACRACARCRRPTATCSRSTICPSSRRAPPTPRCPCASRTRTISVSVVRGALRVVRARAAAGRQQRVPGVRSARARAARLRPRAARAHRVREQYRNVFPEYVLPELAPRASDPALPVRIAYANNIGECGARRAACRACARCRRPTSTCSRMWCAARCVSCVRALPPADSNVFPEYVLPELAPRASDPALPVRIAYANNIGECGARRAACRACARCRRPTATCSRMWCAARCVSCVRALPPADSNVFPEYVLPELAPRASDPALPVRIAYANNIGECGARRAACRACARCRRPTATCSRMWCAARCVSCVRALPPADSNVFPEYVLPELAPRASDPALPVRIAYANNIGECGARRAACRACARCRRPTATCSRMWCAARCVSCVRALPPADSNVFPEYVLPELAPRASDPALPVRIAYANNIGECGARRAACRACARCRRPTATCSRMWCAARCVSCVRALPPADSNVFPEYVLPELAPRASDPALPVRIAYANNIVWCAARCVSCVRALPPADSNVFPEYVLPELAPRASDPALPVRIAYANNIGECGARRAACRACARLPPADSNVFPEYILPELAPRASDPALPVRIAYANNIGECGARRAACRACARCRRPTATCSRMWCAARCVSCVRALPPADSNVFPEYVLPELAPRASDPALPVRIAYANNIGECGARRAACRACARCRRPTATCSRMWCAARCVSCVRALPPADSNVFPEYVLPELAPRASDPALPVRIAYANNIGECGARRAACRACARCRRPTATCSRMWCAARCVSCVRALPPADSNVFPEYDLPELAPRASDPALPVRIAYANNIVWCAARCVSCVRALPPADSNVFPEYVLPELAPRASDPALPVRIAYANNIAKLAETALRFLDQTQNRTDKAAANINYETELSALHEMVRSTVSYLLTDSQAVVKRALVENGIMKLCVFFGKQKANDVILSHMVTFLNDKEEVALRGCFFERVVGVVAYVGQHAAPILLPLLQQGLTDQSEWIIASALRASSLLAALGLLAKQALCDLLAESAVYLAHPNLWIRHEVCGLVSCIASLLNPIDVNCKVLPLVWPHLKHKLIQVDRVELLLESLSEPIPRKVLDAVLRHGDVDRLVQTLRERRSARLKVKQGMMPQYSEMGQQLKNLFRRLASDGMTEHVENQLLAMSAHLIKIQSSSTQHITDAPGRLVLTGGSISRAAHLDSETLSQPVDKIYQPSVQRRSHKTSLSQETQMNTEWQHMFGQTQDQSMKASEQVTQSGQGTTSVGAAQNSVNISQPSNSQMGHSSSYVQYSMAPCRIELRNLISRMQQKFQKSLRTQDDNVEASEDLQPPVTWRPGNQLLAYLHEHKARVNQLVRLPTQRGMFASCSDDGTVRLWDAARLQGHAYVNKSKSMYNRSAGPVISLAACEGGQSLVAATQEGSIFVLRLDSGSSRMSLSQCRQLERGSDACVACASAGGVHAGVISYATLGATIVGWDLRAPGNAWKLQGDLKQGVYTCLYANSAGYLAVGTSSGAVCVWDLRFGLPITSVKHPNSERIRRIVGFGGSSSRVWAAGPRDASAWCLESTQRTHALWPATAGAQPLHYNPASSHYISTVYCGTRDGSRFLISGGSDLRLRFWDLQHPDDSHVLLHAPCDQLQSKYKSRIIDGTTVIQESFKSNPSVPLSTSQQEENVYRTVESRTFYHTAPITDITLVEGNKCYLVSSSADGVINVWK